MCVYQNSFIKTITKADVNTTSPKLPDNMESLHEWERGARLIANLKQ